MTRSTSSNSAILSSREIDAALSCSEFFLSTYDDGDIFGTLRVSPEVQEQHPLFISNMVDLLDDIEGADIIWRSCPEDGWYTLQFTSTLAHYLSLADDTCNPTGNGRCSMPRLSENRLETYRLLQDLLVTR